MSLVDDQIITNQYNALDELGRRVNKVSGKDPMKAAQAVIDFEADMEKAKEVKEKVEPGKTVIDPEELLRGIQDDMTR